MMMVCPIEPCETLPIIQLSELVEVAANYFISGADQKINGEREREWWKISDQMPPQTKTIPPTIDHPISVIYFL